MLPTFASAKRSGRSLKSIVRVLEEYAHPKYAGSWDNVGLLIEPTEAKTVKHILLTNDLTEEVMQEALKLQTDMIISYHPPIFKALKSICTNNWKERIVARCLENRIALYSPHTALDAIEGGVNDWLASALDIADSTPIQPTFGPSIGPGRLCDLKSKINLQDAVQRVKKHCELHNVLVAFPPDSNGEIRTVAVCAGSGASILSDTKADLYLTGEMSHHEVLDAIHQGSHVILTNHSNSERGYLRDVYAAKIREALDDDVEVVFSKNDDDPLVTM
ncbi:unnamed protein product [Trichogramma brassicae]|uniref:NIF3-like protein 1 n=1 Tax=Trichogramma brassicae TaxID=86971 RepID=A0A6H5IMW8_9HYME|nr:unnamed protein product [Trichogramma brassicae]